MLSAASSNGRTAWAFVVLAAAAGVSTLYNRRPAG
jgi:hypothetical protein